MTDNNSMGDYIGEERREKPRDGEFDIERREHKRAEFAYPAVIKVFTDRSESIDIKAYLDNISMGGACIQFEDRYGRVKADELHKGKVKITITMPDGEKITFLSSVKRVQENVPRKFFIELGVGFDNVEDWQIDAIKTLVTMKNKDHNMMWSLWENFEKQL